MLQFLPSWGLKSHPLHMECLYLPWPSPVHHLSLWSCRKAPTGAKSLLWDFSLRTHKTPHRCGPHTPPLQEWTLWHSQPTHKIANAFTCSKSARESELSNTSWDKAFIHCCSKSTSQDVAFTIHCSKSSRKDTAFTAHCSTWGLWSLLGFLRRTPWSEPYSNWKKASSKGTSLGTMQSSHWITCTSCCGCFPSLVNHCSGLSCLHSSRSRALGCLSVLFLPTPAASKPAHICILITRTGVFTSSGHPTRVFTLLIPFACHPLSISPRLATIEVTS